MASSSKSLPLGLGNPRPPGRLDRRQAEQKQDLGKHDVFAREGPQQDDRLLEPPGVEQRPRLGQRFRSQVRGLRGDRFGLLRRGRGRRFLCARPRRGEQQERRRGQHAPHRPSQYYGRVHRHCAQRAPMHRDLHASEVRLPFVAMAESTRPINASSHSTSALAVAFTRSTAGLDPLDIRLGGGRIQPLDVRIGRLLQPFDGTPPRGPLPRHSQHRHGSAVFPGRKKGRGRHKTAPSLALTTPVGDRVARSLLLLLYLRSEGADQVTVVEHGGEVAGDPGRHEWPSPTSPA